MNVNDRKSKQLNMPIGTAANRLRRMVMFNLIQRLGLDICHRCGKKLTLSNYSIDHINPWFNVDPALFWDLDNITFSCKSCNYKLGGNANGGKGSSSYSGVSYDRNRKKWAAYTYNNSVRTWYGYYDTEEEAAKALGYDTS